MVNGPMIEAQQGEAPLGDVDLGTFLRFVQWLYHGYYDAAEPSQIRQPKYSQDDVQNVQRDPFETNPDRYANIEDLSNETNLGVHGIAARLAYIPSVTATLT